MPNWLLVCGYSDTGSLFDGSTAYWQPCGWMKEFQSVEANCQFIARDSYTLSDLFVRVVANTLTNACTVRTRVNGANGNQSVSIGAGATGAFQDGVNSDNLVSGDLFDYQSVAPIGGVDIEFTIMSLVLHTATNTTPIIGGRSSGGISANLTNYAPIGGSQDESTPESKAHYIFRVAATLSNLYAYVSNNNLTAATTVTLRVNSADGNQSITIPAATTGAFEDAVNTDNIASGDDVNYKIVTGAGTTILIEFYELKSNSAGCQVVAAKPTASQQFSGTTQYSVIEDRTPCLSGVEANCQVITEVAFSATNLLVVVAGNSLDATTTVSLRQNGANSALLVSIGPGASGDFEDSDTVAVAVNDLLDFMCDASASTAGAILYLILGFELDQPTGPAGIGDKSAHMGGKMVGAGLI